MKKKFLPVLILLAVSFLTVLVYAGATIDFFQVRSESGKVTIEWKSGAESNLDYYAIDRKTVYGSYSTIKTIQPKGSNSYYSYVDENAYKTNGEVFIYQIRIVENNGVTVGHSKEMSVNNNVSSVKRTWGSIKAMFR